MFVYLPALFYLGFSADHSSDWPRNATVLCRAGWTPDSAMEASAFLLGSKAKETRPLMERWQDVMELKRHTVIVN